jgi:DNA polymerase
MTADASQIEARLTAWLCGQWDLVEQFARGDDVYSLLASDIFGEIVTKKDKAKRQVGKRAELGLGFAAGAKVLYRALMGDAREMGLDLDITPEFAEMVVNVYRNKRNNIKSTWGWLNDMLPFIADGTAAGETFGPCTFEKQAILLPSGLRLHYHELRYERDDSGKGEWRFTFAGKRKKIYGGKVLENVVQALDRVCVMDAAVRVRQRCKDIRLAHQVHDEIIYVPHGSAVAEARKIVEEEMARRPDWGPDLPLAAESGVGPNYGAAK